MTAGLNFETKQKYGHKMYLKNHYSITRLYLKFAFFWLFKGNQYEFLTHPKIKGLDGGLEPPTSRLPVHCSTTWANLTDFRMLLIAYMNVAMWFCDVINSIMMLFT